jgi:hypothetical protein
VRPQLLTKQATSHRFFHTPCQLVSEEGAAAFKPHFNGLEFDASVHTIEQHRPKTSAENTHAATADGLTILAAELFAPNVTMRYEDLQTNVWHVGPDQRATPAAFVGAEIIHWERPAGGQVFAIGSILAGTHLYNDLRLAALFFNALASFGEAHRLTDAAECPAFLQAAL